MKQKLLKKILTIGLTVALAAAQVVPVAAANIGDATSGVASDITVMTTEPDGDAKSTMDAETVMATEASQSMIANEDYWKLASQDIEVVSVSGNDASYIAESADNPTTQEVYNTLISLKSQYPEGMFFDNSCPAGGYMFRGLQVTGVNMRGYGCAGFAFILSDAAFGSLPVRTSYEFNWDAIRVGDILRVVAMPEHSVVVLQKYSDYIIVAEANYGSRVHWGRMITKSELASEFIYQHTRYPEGSNPGSNTPGGNDNPDSDPGSNPGDDENIACTAKDVRTGITKTMYLNDGNYKVLVFGGIGSCGNTTTVMKYLTQIASEKNLKYTELWAFDIQENSDSTMKSACTRYAVGSNMTVINGTNQKDAWEDIYYNCREYAYDEGLISGVLYMPLVIFAKEDGEILSGTVSYQNKDDLYDIMDECGFFSHEKDAANKIGQVQAFVERLYTIALKRDAEAAGLQDWTSKLVSGSKTGSEVASGFFFSDEFKNKNLSDADYVETLYQVMMGRPSDAGGKADWVYKLKNGVGREGVFAGFTGSEEFKNICENYGIKSGEYESTEARNRNTGLTTFVARLYTKALGRQYEVNGINYWCDEILAGRWSINDASTTGFFHSQEFTNKNTNNEEYVKILYHTFFDREPDAAGYADWMNKLNRGVNRDDVLNGFANSQEFGNLKKSYGL